MLKFNFQQKISKTPTNQIYQSKKRSNSSIKYQKTPDIITQVNPLYLNNFIKPINPHPLAFTPTNHSNLLQNKKMLLPQKSKEFINKKTLILDLDETLVHSSFVPFQNNDIILEVELESVIYNIFVLVRPGTIEFIKKVAKLYEVVIFTASISKYALPLLDILDIEKNIKYKLTREHCTFLNGIYIKELKKLNRNLNDLIILDNSPLAYSFDNDNGLPIKAWYEDRDDSELEKVYLLLEFLSKVKDVRNFIKKFVNNNEIDYEASNEIIKLYNENMKDFNHNNNNYMNKSKELKEKENEKILSHINNKENNNIINIKTGDKLIKNINKPNKGILLNDIINTPIYRNLIHNNKKEISYNNFINNINARNNNKMKNSALTSKNKNKETNLKANIQNQKKKNAFRISTKLSDKINNKNLAKTNNIQSKNNNLYFLNNIKFLINNNENDIPFSHTLSKTTKNGISVKNKIQYNINIEANNGFNKGNKNSIMKNNVFPNDNNNNNDINFINKKYKYSNLLENLEKKNKRPNYILNNKINIRSKSSKIMNSKTNTKNNYLNNQNIYKKKLNHVGSYVINKNNGLIFKNSIPDNNSNTNNTVTRSKSTGNFVNFNKNFTKPKSSKTRYNFEKNLLILVNKSNNKYNKNSNINLLEGFPKTTVHKDFHCFINDEFKNNI
jgi:Dullard-like phosphatase family protein